MKRKIIAILVCLMLITGCGNSKKLICTVSESKGLQTYVYENTYVYNDKGDALKSISMKQSVKYSGSTSADADYGWAKDLCNTFKGKKGIKCKHEKKETVITVQINYNYSKLNADNKAEFTDLTNYESAVKALETTKYSCK